MSTIVVVPMSAKRNTCQNFVYVGFVCLCVAQQVTRERAQPVLFLSVHSCEHGWKRIGRTRGNDSGMYKADFPGDDASRAVPSDARHDGWYGPEGRKNLALHSLQRTQGCA